MSVLRLQIERRAIVANVQVGTSEIDQLARYYELLERWNRRMNLTALQLADYPDATIDRIVIEPLATKEIVKNFSGQWIDFGSGGGSPAIPLKIAAPRCNLTMIESRTRKSAFLREAIRQLGLSGAHVWTGRIAMYPQTLAGGAQLITVRAVKMSTELLSAAANLLRENGVLIVFGDPLSSRISQWPLSHRTSLVFGPGTGIHLYSRDKLSSV